MLPDFTADGLLPKGIHWSNWGEVTARYGGNPHRQRLLSGAARAIDVFRKAGCTKVFLDGSFVSDKEFPSDYDACWETNGVVLHKIDPILLDFSNVRAAQKAKYFGEFFPADFIAEAQTPFRTFLNFFQIDKQTGDPKGIVGLNL